MSHNFKEKMKIGHSLIGQPRNLFFPFVLQK